jgi:hypothetical protein
VITWIALAYLAAGVALLLWVNLARASWRADTTETIRSTWRESRSGTIFGFVAASIVFTVSWPLWLALTLVGKDDQ